MPPQRVGVAQTAKAIAALKDAVVEKAGMDPGTRIGRLCAFVAGVDLPVDRDELSVAIRCAFPESDVMVENDVHAALWAGMRRPSGVAVLCDAGINAIAMSATGQTAGFLSFGTISGDWGGALSLGREVLFAAARAEDLRGPVTSLRYFIAAHFSTLSVRSAVAQLHARDDIDDALTDLVPVLFEADDAGDEVAMKIVERLADEIVAMAKSAMYRASISPSSADVILAGSVLAHGHERLNVLVGERFNRELSGTVVTRLDLPTVVGPALAALTAESGKRATAQLARRIAGALSA